MHTRVTTQHDTCMHVKYLISIIAKILIMILIFRGVQIKIVFISIDEIGQLYCTIFYCIYRGNHPYYFVNF